MIPLMPKHFRMTERTKAQRKNEHQMKETDVKIKIEPTFEQQIDNENVLVPVFGAETDEIGSGGYSIENSISHELTDEEEIGPTDQEMFETILSSMKNVVVGDLQNSLNKTENMPGSPKISLASPKVNNTED